MSRRHLAAPGHPVRAGPRPVLLGACSSAGDYATTPLPTPSPTAAPSTSAAPVPAPAPAGTDVATTNCLQSYAPGDTLPAPGDMPAGSTMARIQKRGRLIAGVSADTLLLGARNPISGEDRGLRHRHAARRSRRRSSVTRTRSSCDVITAAQRLPALQDKSVDIVARNMTITCDRWKDIAFSSEYYRSGQKVLVRLGEKTTDGKTDQRDRGPEGQEGLRPQRLDQHGQAAHVQGSRAGRLRHAHRLPGAVPGGRVDAITGDDTVLAGLAAQDPYAQVVQAPAFTAEPYGLGVNKSDVDFVRFVNGVVAKSKSDGAWQRSYQTVARRRAGQGAGTPEACLRADPMIAAPAGTTAPTAPGRLGQALATTDAVRYLEALGTWRDDAQAGARPARRGRPRGTERGRLHRRHAALDGPVEGGLRPLRPAGGDLGLRSGRHAPSSSASPRWCGAGWTPAGQVLRRRCRRARPRRLAARGLSALRRAGLVAACPAGRRPLGGRHQRAPASAPRRRGAGPRHRRPGAGVDARSRARPAGQARRPRHRRDGAGLAGAPASAD